MAMLYANENFPAGVVTALRALGHDVLTIQETGNANQRISDDQVSFHNRQAQRSLQPACISIERLRREVLTFCSAAGDEPLLAAPVK